MQHQMAAAAEAASSEAGMPCQKMAGHVMADQADDTQDRDQANIDRCCGGALCAGYTLGSLEAGVTFFMRSLSFGQALPDALHVADAVLPKRPPRFL
ncbi:hypothetical protein [Roseibium sediminicola]|uniref:Uncharacterized protein n=1 Tax=Roseibium sediminicola TaxID=2933272 RepID=A0ABT0GWR4_9HYPH|nr:hypothetical protein [Roseibium sp. CAU 1639]MCK7613736.1 hypothetical protein [Roseibium sp. CAU 1639]